MCHSARGADAIRHRFSTRPWHLAPPELSTTPSTRWGGGCAWSGQCTSPCVGVPGASRDAARLGRLPGARCGGGRTIRAPALALQGPGKLESEGDWRVTARQRGGRGAGLHHQVAFVGLTLRADQRWSPLHTSPGTPASPPPLSTVLRGAPACLCCCPGLGAGCLAHARSSFGVLGPRVQRGKTRRRQGLAIKRCSDEMRWARVKFKRTRGGAGASSGSCSGFTKGRLKRTHAGGGGGGRAAAEYTESAVYKTECKGALNQGGSEPGARGKGPCTAHHRTLTGCTGQVYMAQAPLPSGSISTRMYPDSPHSVPKLFLKRQ